MKYLVDFILFINRILARFLRRDQRRAWLYSLLKPVEANHAVFLAFRDNVNEDMSYNNITMIFEYLLNKRFNNGNTGIWIETITNIAPPVYVGFLSEVQEPVYVGFLSEVGHDVGIGYLNEYVDSSYDFIVHVPAALVFDMAEMNAVIRKYNMSGKRYTIQTF